MPVNVFIIFFITLAIALFLVRKFLKGTYMKSSIITVLFVAMILALDLLYGVYLRIGVCIICFIAVVYIIKFYNKALRVILLGVILLLTMYGTIISIEQDAVSELKEPIFARYSYTYDTTDVYKGIGYRIEIRGAPVISITMYNIYNKIIAFVIT